jgi:hypothetical protein
MSSDAKDSGAVRQGPSSKATWGQQQSQSVSQEEPLARVQSSAQQSHNNGYAANRSLPNDNNDDLAYYDEPYQSADASPDTTHSFLRRWSPVFIPLILAALTSLIVLPLIAARYARVLPENLWLIVAIIIVATIADIVALYYTDENKGLRMSAITASFFIFVVIASFAIFGPSVGFVVLVALIALAALLIRRYFYAVSDDFVDIVYAFGKYDRTLYAGPNMLLPWEKVAHQLKIREMQWLCPLQRVQLSQTEDVLLHALVSYQLYAKHAYRAVTRAEDWEKQFQDMFINEVQTIGTMFVPDDFISWPQGLHTPSSTDANTDSLARREKVNDYLYHRILAKAEHLGILVHWVGIRDVMIAPHGAELDTEALLTPSPLPEPVEQPQVSTQPDPNLQVTVPSSQASQPSNESIHQQKTHTSPKMSENSPSTAQRPQTSPPKIFKEEALIKAYQAVQDGKITDPLAIRELAANFRAVASDPQANQMVSFDAERAALNLYEQASKYEELYSGKQRV